MFVLLGDFNLTLSSFLGTTSLQNVILAKQVGDFGGPGVRVFKRVLLLLAISLD